MLKSLISVDVRLNLAPPDAGLVSRGQQTFSSPSLSYTFVRKEIGLWMLATDQYWRSGFL